MRTYGPGCPLVFSHIPKTAGTSLGAGLQEALQPSVFVQGLDSSLFGGYGNLDALSRAARSAVHLTPDALPADATLVVGHIAPWTTMTRYPGADHMTVLRIPQVRTISHWLHSRSVSELSLRHWGALGDTFRAGWLPLRDYLEHRTVAPITDNTITRFLAWPHPALSKSAFIDESRDDELVAAAIERLESFRHVNVVENEGFMSEVSAWLGRPLPEVRLNVRTSIPHRRRPDLVAELDPATRNVLDDRCRLDTRVWEHVARRVLPGVDLNALCNASMENAIDRYRAMLHEPDAKSPARRVIERTYEVCRRFDPRCRSSRQGLDDEHSEGRSSGQRSDVSRIQ
jgi:hypothetical protein